MRSFYTETFLNKLVIIETLISMLLTASYFITILLVINYIFISDNPYLKQFKLLMIVSEKLNSYMKHFIIYNNNCFVMLAVIYILKHSLTKKH